MVCRCPCNTCCNLPELSGSSVLGGVCCWRARARLLRSDHGNVRRSRKTGGGRGSAFWEKRGGPRSKAERATPRRALAAKRGKRLCRHGDGARMPPPPSYAPLVQPTQPERGAMRGNKGTFPWSHIHCLRPPRQKRQKSKLSKPKQWNRKLQAVNVTGGTAPMDLKDAVLGDLESRRFVSIFSLTAASAQNCRWVEFCL